MEPSSRNRGGERVRTNNAEASQYLAHSHTLPQELSATLFALFHLLPSRRSLPLFFSLTPILQLKVTYSRKLAVRKRWLGRRKGRGAERVLAEWHAQRPVTWEDAAFSLVASVRVRRRWGLSVT